MVAIALPARTRDEQRRVDERRVRAGRDGVRVPHWRAWRRADGSVQAEAAPDAPGGEQEPPQRGGGGNGGSCARACSARMLSFWKLMGPLILRYKIVRGLPKGPQRDVELERLHDKYAPLVLQNILGLRGLYIKLGQAISVAPVAPDQYRETLAVLQNGVPPKPPSEVRRIIEAGLGRSCSWVDMPPTLLEDSLPSASLGHPKAWFRLRTPDRRLSSLQACGGPRELASGPHQSQRCLPLFNCARSCDELFRRLDDDPIGSASIGQVHRAELHDGRTVVVKIQYPEVKASSATRAG